MISLNGHKWQNEKKINYQKPRWNFLYTNEKQKCLTLACQTNTIVEKNNGIDWWTENKDMANSKQTNLK